MSEINPYSAPTSTGTNSDHASIILHAKDRAKVEAIIKDARQFWLAIFLCILCSAIGAIIIPIWYLVRLLQWHSLAGKYPELLALGFSPNSIQTRFRTSKWRLIAGIVVGGIMFALIVLVALLNAISAANSV